MRALYLWRGHSQLQPSGYISLVLCWLLSVLFYCAFLATLMICVRSVHAWRAQGWSVPPRLQKRQAGGPCCFEALSFSLCIKCLQVIRSSGSRPTESTSRSGNGASAQVLGPAIAIPVGEETNHTKSICSKLLDWARAWL